jgi:hypothetical protein
MPHQSLPTIPPWETPMDLIQLDWDRVHVICNVVPTSLPLPRQWLLVIGRKRRRMRVWRGHHKHVPDRLVGSIAFFLISIKAHVLVHWFANGIADLRVSPESKCTPTFILDLIFKSTNVTQSLNVAAVSSSPTPYGKWHDREQHLKDDLP